MPREVTQAVRAARKGLVLGVYRAALDQQTVLQAAQNGTSTGFLWAHNPIATVAKWARIRRVKVDSGHSTALPTPTAPRLRIVRFTFTGEASGASVTAAKIDAGMPTPVLSLRTAATGLTPALVAALGAVGLAGALTAVGAYAPTLETILDGEEDEWPIIKPGEGIVVYQDTAGTAADTRKFNLSLLWDEIDVA